MKYPIEIDLDELNENGIVETDAKAQKLLLSLTHQTLYEFVIFASFRSWRKRIIEQHMEELEEPIKQILINIARSIHESGDLIGLWNGMSRLDSGEYSSKSLQERLLAVVPPLVWQQVFALEPSVLFAGGEI